MRMGTILDPRFMLDTQIAFLAEWVRVLTKPFKRLSCFAHDALYQLMDSVQIEDGFVQ